MVNSQADGRIVRVHEIEEMGYAVKSVGLNA